jgi:hypothetical protein
LSSSETQKQNFNNFLNGGSVAQLVFAHSGGKISGRKLLYMIIKSSVDSDSEQPIFWLAIYSPKKKIKTVKVLKSCAFGDFQ